MLQGMRTERAINNAGKLLGQIRRGEIRIVASIKAVKRRQ